MASPDNEREKNNINDIRNNVITIRLIHKSK